MKILIKRDTKENWEKYNPVLREGELVCVITDYGVAWKKGDGISHYKNLSEVKWISEISEFSLYPIRGEVVHIDLSPKLVDNQ